ncbi:hypothetical protein FDX22_10070 [Citrobacter sp. TBCS-14]|nr:hypothetical protein FDX22_10070 [Citrobacter sp. TBCS-14]
MDVVKKGYTRHTSRCMCVGCARSPQSLTSVSFWGFIPLPRDSPFGLTPSGPAQALFKTVNRFVLQLKLFRVQIA